MPLAEQAAQERLPSWRDLDGERGKEILHFAGGQRFRAVSPVDDLPKRGPALEAVETPHDMLFRRCLVIPTRLPVEDSDELADWHTLRASRGTHLAEQFQPGRRPEALVAIHSQESRKIRRQPFECPLRRRDWNPQHLLERRVRETGELEEHSFLVKRRECTPRGTPSRRRTRPVHMREVFSGKSKSGTALPDQGKLSHLRREVRAADTEGLPWGRRVSHTLRDRQTIPVS